MVRFFPFASVRNTNVIYLATSLRAMTIQTRPLGRTGADVTILGFGAMELRGPGRGPAIDDETAGHLLNAVLDAVST
jgi:hypothetical protein